MLGAALLMTLVGEQAAAATRTWDGGASASQAWSNPQNWSGDTLPAAADDVVLGAGNGENVVIDVDVTVASLTVDGYQGNVSATPGRALTVTGNFTQTSGFFKAPAYLVVGGRFSNTGGSFDGTAGAVFLTSAAAQSHRLGPSVFGNLSVSDGLTAYWRMDDAANPTRDVSGGRTDLAFESTPGTTTAAPTMFSNPAALAFAGQEQGLTTPAGAPYPALLRGGAWTVSLWFRPNATYFEAGSGSCGESGADGPGAELLSAGEDYALRACQVAATGMNVVRLFFRTTAGGRDCVSTNGFSANGSTWHHVAATGNGGSTRTVHLDGVATSCSFPLAQAYQPGPLRIARHFDKSNYDFGGAIDEVRIYNRAISPSEVGVLRQGRHPTQPPARQVITDPLVVTGDLVIASRVLELASAAPVVGGAIFNFGGGLIVVSPPNRAPTPPPTPPARTSLPTVPRPTRQRRTPAPTCLPPPTPASTPSPTRPHP